MSDRLQNIVDRLDSILERLADSAEPPQRFLSIEAAARYSGLSLDSVRRLLERGDLTALRPVPGRIVIDKAELDRLVLSSTRKPVNGRGRPKA